MKKIVVSIMLAFIMMIGMAVPAYAYWPSQGTNPYPAGAGGDVTQFVENGVIYIAFTKNYNLTVMKKAGAANWEVLGGTAFTAGSYDKYGYVSNCIFRLHPATCTVFFCHLAEQNPPPCRGCLPLHRWCKGSARSLRSGKALASKVQLVNQSS